MRRRGHVPSRLACCRCLCVRGGVTLGAGRARLVDAEALVAAGLARWTAKPMRGLCITAAGITAAGRQPAGGAARMDPIIEMRAGEPAAVNPAESPLAWLHRRKGPDGARLSMPPPSLRVSVSARM